MKDVSFQFRKGDLISLLGPSGCGKTTVLKMMGGLVPSSGGLIELEGRAISAPFPGVGVVFQAPTLMPWRTVLSNVLFPMEVLGKNDARANRAPMKSSSWLGSTASSMPILGNCPAACSSASPCAEPSSMSRRSS